MLSSSVVYTCTHTCGVWVGLTLFADDSAAADDMHTHVRCVGVLLVSLWALDAVGAAAVWSCAHGGAWLAAAVDKGRFWGWRADCDPCVSDTVEQVLSLLAVVVRSDGPHALDVRHLPSPSTVAVCVVRACARVTLLLRFVRLFLRLPCVLPRAYWCVQAGWWDVIVAG